MIPWANFEIGLRHDPIREIQVPLQKEWLTWVEVGPSMKDLFLESPMLEIAHERQFAVSQRGGNSDAFVDEHTSRMEDCLLQLGAHFHNFAIDDQCQPTSPFGADLMQCWRPDFVLSGIPPLSLEKNRRVRRISSKADDALNNVSSTPVPSSAVPAPLIRPEPELEAGELSDSTTESLKQVVQGFPRARTTLPIHSARAPKTVRQRKRFESKFANEPAATGQKRGSYWMADQHEDSMEATIRRQSLVSYRANAEANPLADVAEGVSHMDET